MLIVCQGTCLLGNLLSAIGVGVFSRNTQTSKPFFKFELRDATCDSPSDWINAIGRTVFLSRNSVLHGGNTKVPADIVYAIFSANFRLLLPSSDLLFQVFRIT